MYFLLALVLLIGVLTYAIRGLYWSLLDACRVPLSVTGLAIGLISVIGICRHFPADDQYRVYRALPRCRWHPLLFRLYRLLRPAGHGCGVLFQTTE
jgi:hypothetical protein